MHDEWTKQAEWMRQVGAVSATWELVESVVHPTLDQRVAGEAYGLQRPQPTSVVRPALVALTLGPPPPTPKTQPVRPPDEPKQGTVVPRRIGSVPGLTRRASGGSD